MTTGNQAKTHPPMIRAMLSEKRRQPEGVLDHMGEGDDLIAGMFNSEPLTVLDAIEAGAHRLSGVRIHQMLPFRERPYMHGAFPGLRHVSWFLSPANREAFHKDTCDLVPNNFSEVPALMRRTTKCSLMLAAASPPDRHGYFSLGTHADYAAALIGEVPFFVEVNHRMPRTYGENQVHVSQVVGWCEADYPLTELPARPVRETDRKIAAYVAERIPDTGRGNAAGGYRVHTQRGARATRRSQGRRGQHRAALRRVRRAYRKRCDQWRPQKHPPEQGRRGERYR
jgi:acyl-CoA hydrolase